MFVSKSSLVCDTVHSFITKLDSYRRQEAIPTASFFSEVVLHHGSCDSHHVCSSFFLRLVWWLAIWNRCGVFKFVILLCVWVEIHIINRTYFLSMIYRVPKTMRKETKSITVQVQTRFEWRNCVLVLNMTLYYPLFPSLLLSAFEIEITYIRA